MNKTKYFLFLSVAAVMLSGSLSGLPAAYAGDTVNLEEIGVLQLGAHDLFNVNRATEIDIENGKLDLSTLFTDMNTGLPFSLSDVAKGGEPRNRENILLFSVASVIGQNYVDDILINELSEQVARQNALNAYHTRFNAAYLSAFGESVPNPINGCVTMTENLAFRTLHDFLPGKIRLDTNPVPVNPLDTPPVIDTNDDLFLTIFDPPAGFGFTPPFDDPGMNANGHTGPLLAFEQKQPTSELDGIFDTEFLNIDIFIPPSTMIMVNLLDADKSFGDQFNTDFSFQHFLDELKDGSYDPNEDVMNEIRDLIAKGYGGCFIGGEIIPIDTTVLLLAAAQSPAAWLTSLTIAALGISAYVFTRNSNNMRNIKVILRDYLDRL